MQEGFLCFWFSVREGVLHPLDVLFHRNDKVPYNGKLKKFTDKKTIPQFIPQIWFGNEKLVAVSVILEDHIIFIEKNTFKMYQKGLCASDSVELVMRPNIRE